MHSQLTLSSISTILLSLTHLPQISASVCRNITNSYYSTETSRQFSTTSYVPLYHILCPVNTSVDAEPCLIPRETHNITIPRNLNFTTSPEDEDAIFEAARIGYWSRNLANNESLWDKEWDDKQRTVNLQSREWGDFLFEVRPGYNWTLNWVSYSRFARGTLGGCDNETLNGMGFDLRVPYLENNTVPENQTEVAGQLIGGGQNVTDELLAGNGDGNGTNSSAGGGGGGTNDADRAMSKSMGLVGVTSLAVLFAVLL